jgi:hypothetical protein
MTATQHPAVSASSPERPVSERILAEMDSAASSSTRRDTLARLKEACDSLAKRGQPLRLAGIEKEIKKKHGPKAGPSAQSMANDKEGMRRYVASREREREAETPASERRGRRAAGAALSLLLDSMKDPDARSRLMDLHDRCRLAETSLARAKALLSALDSAADIDALLSGKPAASLTPATQGVDPSCIDALRRLTAILGDEKKLAAAGLIREPGGRVRRKTGTGDELVPPSVISGVELLLRTLTSSGPQKSDQL